MTNSLVNNVTNMTLLIGLPAIFWTMNVLPQNTAQVAAIVKLCNRMQIPFTPRGAGTGLSQSHRAYPKFQ